MEVCRDQTRLKYELTLSNLAFVAPPLYVLGLRLKNRHMPRISDAMLVLAYCTLAVVSYLYHLCDADDDEAANVLDYCNRVCYLERQQLHNADLFAAGFVAHVTITLNWEPEHKLAQLWLQVISYVFPFGTFFLFTHWQPYLYFVLVVGGLDFFMRCAFPTAAWNQLHMQYYTDSSRQLPKQYSQYTCMERLESAVQERFPFSSFRMAIFFWLPLAASCLIMSILLQYTEHIQSDSSYGFKHSLWHGLAAAAGLFTTIALARNFEATKLKDPSDGGYASLNDAHPNSARTNN